MDNKAEARRVISNFRIEGECIDLKVNTQGHINSTFISTFRRSDGSVEKYTHQRINKNVFMHPDEVMENILAVTKHIRKQITDPSGCLTVIMSKDGKPYYLDEAGEYWRSYIHIDDVDTFDSITEEKQAYELGKGIGTFQLQLSSFPAERLHTTIEHFHDMGLRFSQLQAAMKADVKGRTKEVEEEISYLFDNKERGERIWKSFVSGHLPCRVTHNDTKMNNVLFSRKSGKALCVIDLDTIMPGTILFDTGDMIRTACNLGGEDEKNTEKVRFSYPFYKALIEGYEETATFLTEEEKAGIAESGRTITEIMAVRFLTDYIAGDVYYHTSYEKNNLDRSRNQIALMKDMDNYLFQ